MALMETEMSEVTVDAGEGIVHARDKRQSVHSTYTILTTCLDVNCLELSGDA